jgi:RND family efflux transporter MFP subunit
MPIKSAKNALSTLLCALLLATQVLAADEAPAGFDCVITPSRSVDLGSPVPGQLAEVLVDRSDRVKAGQVVASLDSRLEEANLAIANFRAETDTEVKLRKAAWAIDLRTERRLSSLEASKVASAQERDRASREARLSRWRTRQAEDALVLSGLEKARAEAALDRRKIRSPIDGVVVARLHNPGEYIEDQALLRIVRLDPLHVEAILPMRLFGKVRPGMTAKVLPEPDQGQALEAEVLLVDPMGDAASGTFGARLELPNPEGDIPAGLKCRMQLSTDGPLLSAAPGPDSHEARIAANPRPE